MSHDLIYFAPVAYFIYFMCFAFFFADSLYQRGAGLVASYALTRMLWGWLGWLYEVNPTDPATFIGVSLLLSTVALLACYIPARRATKLDPVKTIRHE
ncbi:MAG TPA: hypothetical protein VJ810_23410 [Blastocatellia bacterium]|nr:hypothetical protein [Blastocatellia bacterium]